MRRFLLSILLLIMIFFWPCALKALTTCPGCGFVINLSAVECPKCLKLIKWPYSPARQRRAEIIVRTGKDAFIRDRHSQNRAFRFDRNAGGDLSGSIGSWGGPTTLRYLIRFDIPAAFAAAQKDMNNFRLRRATLKLVTASKGSNKGNLPVRVYGLTREFQQGRDTAGTRDAKIRGCTWVYAAPLILWHREGGDFDEALTSSGIIKETGESYIDVTDIIAARFAEFFDSGIFNDPGMIIMRDPHLSGDFGYLNIFSIESTHHRDRIKSPELFLE